MFGTVGGLRPETAWGALWEVARERLIELQAEQVASVVTESWYGRVLSNSGFEHNHDIVVMAWDHKHTHPIIPPHEGIVRELTQDDFDTVFGIDWNAFSPLWQNSRVSLQAAYDQSNICTVYEENHRILGYQISTPAPLGGHLARLAVHPDAQGQGIGYLLVQDLLDRFRQQGALRVTVNTQSDNYASLALYKKAKFQQIDRPIPVYEHKLPAGF
jgi:ribosomal-protein-alanine N-acetyltransferase